MKNIKKIIIILLICTLTLSGGFNYSLAKIKVIRLNKGETYNLNISNRKVVKLSSSNKSIATVNKNGKIKARKKGKCIIKVVKGKKETRYKVVVKNKKKADENSIAINNTEPSASPNPKDYAVGGVLYCGNLIFEKMVEKDSEYYYVYFHTEDNKGLAELGGRDINKLVLEVKKEIVAKMKKPLKPGDRAGFVYVLYPRGKTIITEETLYFTGWDIELIENFNQDDIPTSTMPPTPAPVDGPTPE